MLGVLSAMSQGLHHSRVPTKVQYTDYPTYQSVLLRHSPDITAPLVLCSTHLLPPDPLGYVEGGASVLFILRSTHLLSPDALGYTAGDTTILLILCLTNLLTLWGMQTDMPRFF
jgi:hypothetical protein